MNEHENLIRNQQQETIFGRIKDPTSRAILKECIPIDKIHDYTWLARANSVGSSLIDIMQEEKEEVFRVIFGVAATAQNPTQLINAFGTLRGIEVARTRKTFGKQTVDEAMTNFLRSARTTPQTSEDTKEIQLQMIGIWNDLNSPYYESSAERREEKEQQVIQRVEIFVQQKVMQDYEKSQYWTEAYLLTVLDPNTPFGLRKNLLSRTSELNFGVPNINDRRFSQDTSFWQNVGPEWIYPELFSSQKQRDRAGAFTGEKTDQAGSVNEQRAGGNGQETRLKQEIERLRMLIAYEQAKSMLYKDIGGDPLRILDISPSDWRTSEPIERQELVKKAYYKLSHRYHPDVINARPDPDGLLKELTHAQFNRLTKAYDYLNRHLDRTGF